MKKFFSGEGIILRFLRFITDFFYHAVGIGLIGRLFSSYNALDAGFSTTAVGRIGTGNGKLHRRLRQSIVLAMDENIVMRGIRFLKERLLCCGLRTVGLFLLISGVYTSVVYWLANFVWRTGAVSTMSLLSGLSVAVVGTLMLFSDTSLGYSLRNGVLFGLFARVFDLSDEKLRNVSQNGVQYYAVAVSLGMVVGAVGALFDPLKLCLGISLLLLACFVFSVPEAGVLLLLLFLPFAGLVSLGDTALLLLAALPVLGYFVKLLRGNRAFRLQLQDLPIWFMALVFLLSGASFAQNVTAGSVIRSVLFVLLYVLVVNVITTPGWMLRCRVALLISAAFSAAVGILQFVLAIMADLPPSGVVRAGFADATGLAYFLLLAYPFALYAVFTSRRYFRLAALSALILVAGGTVLSGVQSAAIAVVVMTVIFLLFYEKRSFFAILAGGGVLSIVSLVLPVSVQTRLTQLFLEEPASVPVRHLFRGARSGGIGSGFSRVLFGLGEGGVEQFSKIFIPYFTPITAQNTNFFTYVLCQYGLIGLLPPLVFLLFLLQNACALFFSGRFGEKRHAALPGMCLAVGVLVNMFFHYTWWDGAAMALFFLLAGLAAAALRQERNSRARAEQPQNDSSGAEFEFFMS